MGTTHHTAVLPLIWQWGDYLTYNQHWSTYINDITIMGWDLDEFSIYGPILKCLGNSWYCCSELSSHFTGRWIPLAPNHCSKLTLEVQWVWITSPCQSTSKECGRPSKSRHIDRVRPSWAYRLEAWQVWYQKSTSFAWRSMQHPSHPHRNFQSLLWGSTRSPFCRHPVAA